ncbi:OLC1v1036728C1 [Oldenlandia corymbosa var. corymbosa]|uniref:OLC1v1036728C1 n=1 Tax=Oldenlandia corymbosa var. corymbosa TaxID=529605 RepID=A0AAV1CXC8_OLDCO|nr:OLC1v1036728C1 [Oldenlandia corymbosa var. corymbosa]
MIFNEVLRLYPSFPVLMRQTHEETKLREFNIPVGVIFTLRVWMLHRDPKIWGDDASEFRPERFKNGISNATTKEGQFGFSPFGYGARTCIGQNFTMVEAKLVLAMIL